MTRPNYAVEATEEILQEFPMRSTYDAIVVGGGPNGLMTAAYLAKAGLKTIVVERRHEIGGGLATEETLFPGFYTNPHAIYHMMTEYMPVLRDFDMTAHGLSFVMPNAQLGMVFSDRTSLLLCNQVEDTKDSIAKLSQRDARTFGHTIRTWRRIVEDVVAPGTYLPPLSPVDMAEALERTAEGRETLRLSEMSPIEIVDELFENDRVKALLLYASCMWGLDPHDTGLGFLVPMMIDRAAHKAQCYGGSHKLAGALSRVIHLAGGTILDQSEVTEILVSDGKVTGVACFDGRVIEAKIVVSSLAPPLTFGKLIATDQVPGELAELAEHWEWDRWSFFTLALATTVEPTFEVDDPWVNNALMTVAGFDGTEDLLGYWDGVHAGRIGDRVGGHITVETRLDPTLPRVPGHHVSFFQVHAPYDVEGGWKVGGDELADRLLDVWRRAAPNLDTASITARSAETPVDIETRLASMVRGSIKHGDYNSLQMGVFRPHDTCIGGRTPIDGLYLCGASSYPGGLIIGGGGYIAATSIVEDAGATRWWTVPRFIEKYRETYLS